MISSHPSFLFPLDFGLDTANLAAFLSFAGQEPAHVFYASIDQVVRRELPICVNRFAAPDIYISEKYPDANLVRIESEEELFLALRENRCGVVATQRYVFEQFKGRSSTNSDCQLRTSGIAQNVASAGFVTAMDSGVYCSSLISNTVNIHMIEMQADGFIEKTWNNYLKLRSDISCPALAEAEKENELDGVDNQRLDVYEMGGIFCFHYILCAIAFCIAFIEHRQEKRIIEALKAASARHVGNGTATEEEDGPEDDNFFENGVDESAGREQSIDVVERRQLVRQSMWDSGHRVVSESANLVKRGRSLSVWNQTLRRRVPKTEQPQRRHTSTAVVQSVPQDSNGNATLNAIMEDSS